MSGRTGPGPFIKSEPDDSLMDPHQYAMSAQPFNGRQQFQNQYGQFQNAGVDPSALSMSNGSYNNPFYSGNQPTMSGSYNMGTAQFNDDELLESLDYSGSNAFLDGFDHQASTNELRNPTGISMSHQGQMTNIYSHTPDGPPIQSPYLGNFDYNGQFKSLSSLPQHMSPRPGPQFKGTKRPSMHGVRKSSDQRPSMTPQTNALAGLHIGTPESVSLQNGRPIRTPSTQSRHQKTLSGYDSTPGSLNSYLESPLSSPLQGGAAISISEAMANGQHSSLPKSENGPTSMPNPDDKKKKRRASHNLVERRRRDHINDRIQDLSHVVPPHRLDDDRIKKQLSGSPLSPIVGPTGVSPPNAAAALLAGPNGRRATSTAGNITLGLPLDDKEKGPNKGDILTGSVGWTRDLMWALHSKYVQEEELAQLITQLGGTWPFEVTDDDRRMRSELIEVIEKVDANTLQYTRTDGSGLRVPKFTNAAGQRLPTTSNPTSSMSPQSMLDMSPGFHSGGSGTNSGSGGPGQPQFWNSAGHPGISFKEEDEFMEL